MNSFSAEQICDYTTVYVLFFSDEQQHIKKLRMSEKQIFDTKLIEEKEKMYGRLSYIEPDNNDVYNNLPCFTAKDNLSEEQKKQLYHRNFAIIISQMHYFLFDTNDDTKIPAIDSLSLPDDIRDDLKHTFLEESLNQAMQLGKLTEDTQKRVLHRLVSGFWNQLRDICLQDYSHYEYVSDDFIEENIELYDFAVSVTENYINDDNFQAFINKYPSFVYIQDFMHLCSRICDHYDTFFEYFNEVYGEKEFEESYENDIDEEPYIEYNSENTSWTENDTEKPFREKSFRNTFPNTYRFRNRHFDTPVPSPAIQKAQLPSFRIEDSQMQPDEYNAWKESLNLPKDLYEKHYFYSVSFEQQTDTDIKDTKFYKCIPAMEELFGKVTHIYKGSTVKDDRPSSAQRLLERTCEFLTEARTIIETSETAKQYAQDCGFSQHLDAILERFTETAGLNTESCLQILQHLAKTTATKYAEDIKTAKNCFRKASSFLKDAAAMMKTRDEKDAERLLLLVKWCQALADCC